MDAAECKRLRKRSGWTQDEMAEAMGVNRVTVAKWEAGTRDISESRAKLMRLLVAAETEKRQAKRPR